MLGQRNVSILVAVVCLTALAAAHGQRRAIQPVPAGAGAVNLPHSVQDNQGNQWLFYQGGWAQQGGNMPLFSQAGMLMINSQHVATQSNQARIDEKTGEIIFENFNFPSVAITRRVKVFPEEGFVRYIDVFRNQQNQEANLTVGYQSNCNYGIAATTAVNDPRDKNRQLGVIAQMHPGRAIFEVYGGRNVKSVATIQQMPNNNMFRAAQQISIPAGKEVALMHLHGTAATSAAAEQLINDLRENKLLADVPQVLRRLIINFGTSSNYIGDREILRGDLFDVIELRGGDAVRGTLNEPVYALQTPYGQVDLPAERVVAMMNVGQFRPRQLLVTVDGEIFGGTLVKETIDLELSSGQVTQVPLSQITRLGYRKRPGEREEWTFDQPLVMLRSGDRIGIAMPDQPIEVLTRYGMLRLTPQSLAAIVFVAEEHGVHQILLTDGSAFAGLVNAPQFDFTLAAPSSQPVSFASAALQRLQLSAQIAEPDDDTPMLTLANEDVLIGTLSGQLKLDTAFDTIVVDAGEVRGLTRVPEAGLDVQLVLWDQTTVSGQLQDPQLSCALHCGIEVSVPLALVEEYSNPSPKPSESMIRQIKSVVTQLSAEDWNVRENAEQQLIQMGPVVAGVLREMQHAQPPEAQQRIESILKQLGKKPAPPPIMPMDE